MLDHNPAGFEFQHGRAVLFEMAYRVKHLVTFERLLARPMFSREADDNVTKRVLIRQISASGVTIPPILVNKASDGHVPCFGHHVSVTDGQVEITRLSHKLE